jgi:hypothetical protein
MPRETSIMTSYFCTRKQATIATIFAYTPIPPINSDLLIDQKPYKLVEISQQIDRRGTKDICETFFTVDPLFPE